MRGRRNAIGAAPMASPMIGPSSGAMTMAPLTAADTVRDEPHRCQDRRQEHHQDIVPVGLRVTRDLNPKLLTGMLGARFLFLGLRLRQLGKGEAEVSHGHAPAGAVFEQGLEIVEQRLHRAAELDDLDEAAVCLFGRAHRTVDRVCRFDNPDGGAEGLPAGGKVNVDTADTRQSGFLLRRAIRLDVSQRPPPITCTSA